MAYVVPRRHIPDVPAICENLQSRKTIIKKKMSLYPSGMVDDRLAHPATQFRVCGLKLYCTARD